MAAIFQFETIYHGLSPEVGKMRVAASGLAWKGASSEEVTYVQATDLKWAQWLRVARGWQLRLGMRDHKKHKFDGFVREASDHDKLAKVLKEHFGITLETRENTFKGWNWGVTDFQGQELAFNVSDRTVFELALGDVANSNIAGKTEVSLEFTPGSSTKGAKVMGDELTEIRFYVPGTINKIKGGGGSDAGSQKSDAEDEEEISAAQVFHDMVKDRAKIGQVHGDLILSFEEVLVLTPRGRYDMDMFPSFLRLRGKTYDYKIVYQSISKLFLLPKDDQQVLFILGLSTPIRQGQTHYQYLVMQFSREEEITAELNMNAEELDKYEGKLKKNYEDPTYEVVSSVFRGLAGKKIIGSGSFQSREGHPGVKANLKAVQGDLFMLEKYLFFVSKSPLLIDLNDIYQVVFSRVGAGTTGAAGRTFDLKIITKSGPEHSFTSINKSEHEVTEAFLRDKRVKVKNEMVPDAELLLGAVDDDDESMASVVSSDEDSRGKSRPKVSRGGPDDDSEEEDVDFQASESDSGSPSESDSEASGAETASDASGDRAITANSKSKGKGKAADGGKKKRATKKKAKASSGDEADGADGADDDAKAKPRPKPKAKPKEKAKPKLKDGDDDAAMEIDDDKPKPKPKPKPKAKPKAATAVAGSSKDGDDGMDVDEDKPKPKPKPKPKAKAKKDDTEADVEPPKKKPKTAS
ncbi:structure-specific recognition protein-domain-containing protein [Crepidotus variabilis]|uniref:FACT complex subunit POB3 n=1 Tax=Crepidotus variabilis TaxID=179855 RepID=A0A9P6EHQ1_9AGAR|nr:structure-specific recognition protein-domain-containing protein [Crepidotus variabilis]